MKLRPLLDKVVLKQVEAVETTKAGIILPGSAQEKPEVSEIVAVGPGGLVDGKEVVMTLKEGDKVQLIGFGTFEAKATAEREGRNPRTGETIKIAAAKKPAFTASKAFKDQLN